MSGDLLVTKKSDKSDHFICFWNSSLKNLFIGFTSHKTIPAS